MPIILCKCCNAGLISDSIGNTVQDVLNRSGQTIYCVDDLCALAAKNDDLFQQWARAETLTVLACFPRTVDALFSRVGTDLPDQTQFINLRTLESPQQAQSALKEMDLDANDPDNTGWVTVNATDPNWQPWFPTIDYHRCKNCKQCLNFCLFGVYTLKEAEVKVTQPEKCKTGCPACARVCPYAAIIFPKYDKSPINGDAVDENLWKQDHADSAESLKDRLKGNIYQMLKNRGKTDANPQSLDDLKELKDKFDIPDQVFDAEKGQS